MWERNHVGRPVRMNPDRLHKRVLNGLMSFLTEGHNDGGFQHFELTREMHRTGARLGNSRQAISAKIAGRGRMALDRIGHIEEIFQVVESFGPHRTQGSADQESGWSGKPSAVFPAQPPWRFAHEQIARIGIPIDLSIELPPGSKRQTASTPFDVLLKDW
jgi:hypothetical protein